MRVFVGVVSEGLFGFVEVGDVVVVGVDLECVIGVFEDGVNVVEGKGSGVVGVVF